jgi:hypothetical protein
MLFSAPATLADFKALRASKTASLPYLESSVGCEDRQTSEVVLENVSCLSVEDWRDW